MTNLNVIRMESNLVAETNSLLSVPTSSSRETSFCPTSVLVLSSLLILNCSIVHADSSACNPQQSEKANEHSLSKVLLPCKQFVQVYSIVALRTISSVVHHASLGFPSGATRVNARKPMAQIHKSIRPFRKPCTS
jgi:hypothetical protein